MAQSCLPYSLNVILLLKVKTLRQTISLSHTKQI
jgi:hypothetical protein